MLLCGVSILDDWLVVARMFGMVASAFGIIASWVSKGWNISDQFRETFQKFLGSFQKFWKVSRNLPEMFHPFAT